MITRAVPLAHRRTGDAGGPPLVVLHGLLGSSRNWQTVARDLAARFTVFAPDLRNHGASPASDACGYPELAADVLAWMDANGLARVHLAGHSMGGKTAMRLAAEAPHRLLSLTVVDIAPRAYPVGGHAAEFEAMAALDVATLRDRPAADEALAARIPDWALRQFLLTNLARRDDGAFFWSVNHRALAAALPEICANPLADGEGFSGPTAFITGGESPYVRPEDHAEIRARFPAARLATIAGAGHNPHIETRPAFVAAMLENLPSP